jgi:hypothetical protein
VKFLKLLAVPAVVLLSLIVAAPAFANGLSKATITVGCGAGATAGQICVHLHGDNEVDPTKERILVFDVFAASDLTKSLGEVTFDVKAPATKDTPFDQTKCFLAITSGTSFVVQLVKVTDEKGNPSDFQFLAPGGQPGHPFIDFDNAHSQPVKVGEAGKCVGATPTPTATPTPSISASPVATLAQTGGLDYRWPIAGLTLLVVGGALFVIAGTRRRSSDNS